MHRLIYAITTVMKRFNCEGQKSEHLSQDANFGNDILANEKKKFQNRRISVISPLKIKKHQNIRTFMIQLSDLQELLFQTILNEKKCEKQSIV